MPRLPVPCRKVAFDLLAKSLCSRSGRLVIFGAALIVAAFGFCARLSHPAQESSRASQELVADLAAGRVIVAVVKGAIIIACVENPIESETRIPTLVEMNTGRAGIILGAVDWFSPSTQQEVAQLEKDLRQVHSTSLTIAPHLQSGQGGDAATDIQSIGQGFLERLNSVANGLHAKVDLPTNDPLAELIIADYIGGYGPEVWQLSYAMKQVEEQRDYWSTRVTMPQYLQFWPPEKGRPHTLMEFAYPPENAPTPLLDLLKQKDQRVQALLADPTMLAVADSFLQGNSPQLAAGDTAQFLRAALNSIAPKSRQAMAIIGEETGFQWVIQPAPESQHSIQPSSQQAAQQNQPTGAPSLLGHH